MCRLYGYCGRVEQNLSQVLLNEENCLKKQSIAHRDGWGICFYEENQPHVLKSQKMAKSDRVFNNIASAISSRIFIAHLRRATQGPVNFLNCHPFFWQEWSFAHNGDLPHFKEIAHELRLLVNPRFLANIRGFTDSELYFALFLTEWQAGSAGTPEVKNIALALRATVNKIQKTYEHWGKAEKPALNAIVTNGLSMVALRCGHELSFRTEPSLGGSEKAQFLEISSEPLSKNSAWSSMAEGQIIGVDKDFKLFLDL